MILALGIVVILLVLRRTWLSGAAISMVFTPLLCLAALLVCGAAALEVPWSGQGLRGLYLFGMLCAIALATDQLVGGAAPSNVLCLLCAAVLPGGVAAVIAPLLTHLLSDTWIGTVGLTGPILSASAALLTAAILDAWQVRSSGIGACAATCAFVAMSAPALALDPLQNALFYLAMLTLLNALRDLFGLHSPQGIVTSWSDERDAS